MTRPLLLTGATGFLGRELVRELGERGWVVHATAREGSRREAVSGDVIWHEADLTDPASLARTAQAVAAAGPEPALVHAGAVISYKDRDGDLQRRVNVEGTRALLDAARRAGFTRGVHVSSVVTVAHSTDGAEYDERAEFNGASLGVDYVTTKHEAEVVASGFARSLGLCIVNPGVVYGRGGAASNSARFVEVLARGGIGPFAPPGGISVVGVEDVAKGVALALEGGDVGRRYILVERYLPLRELFRLAAVCLREEGIPAKVPPLVAPAALWPAAVWGARQVGRIREIRDATPQALRMLGCRWRLSGDRARRELGWSPLPFEDALLETIRDLQNAGRLS